MPMNKYGDMEIRGKMDGIKTGGGMEGMGELKTSYDKLMDPEDRELEQFKVRKEAYLKKLQKMYRIDRDTADQLMDKFGGLSAVIKSFQMVDDDELKAGREKGQTLLEQIRGTRAGYENIKKESEGAE